MSVAPIIGPKPVPTHYRPRCRWCAKRLRPYFRYNWTATASEPTSRELVGYGVRGDNYFCTQACGYERAVERLRSLSRSS